MKNILLLRRSGWGMFGFGKCEFCEGDLSGSGFKMLEMWLGAIDVRVLR